MTNLQIIYLLVAGIVISKIIIGVLISALRKRNKRLLAEQSALQRQHTQLKQYAATIEHQRSELAAAQEFKLKILSITTHDLRVPFNSLQMVLNYLEQRKSTEENLDSAFLSIRTQLETSHMMLDNLLRWTTGQLDNKIDPAAHFSLSAEIDSTIRLFTPQIKEKNVTVENGVQPSAIAFGNIEIFQFVIRNLLSNAIKYSPDNGKVLVGLAFPRDSAVAVFVSDNGNGMDEKTLELVNGGRPMGKYEQERNESGFGVGLSLCHDLIKQSDWILEATSESGEGTTFMLLIPASDVTLDNNQLQSAGVA